MRVLPLTAVGVPAPTGVLAAPVADPPPVPPTEPPDEPPPNGNPGIVPPWLQPDPQHATVGPQLFLPTDPAATPPTLLDRLLRPGDPTRWRIM